MTLIAHISDLHVSNIYNEAIAYDPAALGIGVGAPSGILGHYNPTGTTTRLGEASGLGKPYLTLEQRLAAEQKQTHYYGNSIYRFHLISYLSLLSLSLHRQEFSSYP